MTQDTEQQVTDYSPPTTPAPNGSRPENVSPMLSPAGRKYKDFAVTADPDYRGYKFRAWINFPRRLADDLNSGDDDRIGGAMSRILIWHNGWPDPETGDPLPALRPDDGDADRVAAFQEFWDAIPQDLSLIVGNMIGVQVGKASASVIPRPRR